MIFKVSVGLGAEVRAASRGVSTEMVGLEAQHGTPEPCATSTRARFSNSAGRLRGKRVSHVTNASANRRPGHHVTEEMHAQHHP